jgi:hypothetical protein
MKCFSRASRPCAALTRLFKFISTQKGSAKVLQLLLQFNN